MQISDYVKARVGENGFGFSTINDKDQIDYYLSSVEFDRTSYEHKYSRIVLIYKANLNQEVKEKINRVFQSNLG
ncbi:hypothetical protein F3J02_03805 [Acinetobacter sp. Tr-809]|uniref:hypothetical protein n=1 Tax=Acinetobacter sp. Tr-809 TaxID=2608324 RepID=UPI001421DC1D|nr:hypothetical protein [Acinetobacter sp. Tr-809]NIE95614.1 hypothetical protein [Acinetobacter sp. Tr-809]